MESIEQLCDRILATLWRHAPVSATYLGVHEHDSRLASFDRDALAAESGELRAHLAALRSRQASSPPPTPDQQLDLSLLEGELETLLRNHAEIRAPFRNPLGYLEEAAMGVYLLMIREHAPAEQRARSLISRLSEVPRILEEARTNLDPGQEVPRLWAEMSLEMGAATGVLLGEAARWAKERASALGEEAERAGIRARGAVSSFLEFLKSGILPSARGTFAVGRDYFEFLMRVSHGVPDGVAELEEFGRSEIARAQEALRACAASLGGGSWEDLLRQYQADTPSPQGLLAAYRAEIERAREFLRQRDLVDLPPAASLEIGETPEFERGTTPFAAYVPPAPFDTRQRGIFWVTPPDASQTPEETLSHMKEHMFPAIPITCVHEGYPGHHVQLSLANRAASPTRRQISTPVLIEGWALYCEEMMAEQGYYGDPRTRLVQLKDYLWRCCRVVIDVGLQTGELAFEEAVAILVDVARINPAGARREVRRYSKSPTQPLSYAVGKREILRLRDDIAAREGASFSLPEFHRRLLRYGSIPISRIREQILPAA